MIVTTPDNINRARLLALKGALHLEIHGMKRRGRSAYALVKSEFGFRGNKQKVYDQLVDHLKEGERNDEE